MKKICFSAYACLCLVFNSCKTMHLASARRVTWSVQAEMLTATTREQFFLPLGADGAIPQYFVAADTLIAVRFLTDNSLMASQLRERLLATGLVKSIKVIEEHE